MCRLRTRQTLAQSNLPRPKITIPLAGDEVFKRIVKRSIIVDMIKKFPYWIYVVGVFVVWAIVLLVARGFLSSSRYHNLLIFASGFLLGVLAASLARKVYK